MKLFFITHNILLPATGKPREISNSYTIAMYRKREYIFGPKTRINYFLNNAKFGVLYGSHDYGCLRW